MRILVMGAGAVGSVVGGFMAKVGHEVTLLGREGHMSAIHDKGLGISGIWGEHLVTDLGTITDPKSLSANCLDLIVITVKSFDTVKAVEAVKPLIGDGTLVCSYQNGLGNTEAIADIIGRERTVTARLIYGVKVTKPGCVEVDVIAKPTAIGVYDGHAPAEKAREIAEAMDEAGLPTVYSDSILTDIWEKVAYNSALNPLSALLDVAYGQLTENPHTRDLMRQVLEELYAVGAAMGVALKPATCDEYFDLFLNKLVPPTAAHYASMHADFQNRRRTEIDALNGAVASFGDKHGVPCPVNAALTQMVRAREFGYGIA